MNLNFLNLKDKIVFILKGVKLFLKTLKAKYVFKGKKLFPFDHKKVGKEICMAMLLFCVMYHFKKLLILNEYVWYIFFILIGIYLI